MGLGFRVESYRFRVYMVLGLIRVHTGLGFIGFWVCSGLRVGKTMSSTVVGRV